MCLPHKTHGLVRGGAHTYPAVMLDGISAEPAGAVVALDAPAELDPDLLEAGAGHIDAVRASGAEVWDGPILTYNGARGGAVLCRHSSYLTMLATSGALAAELSAAGDTPLLADLPLRRLAIRACGGDPLASGRGRAAAVGLNIALVARGDGGRKTLLGRRSARMAALPGLWSFVAGNVEPDDGPRPLPAALARELDEEIPALSRRDAESAVDQACVHGACMSLGRLGPSLLASTEIDSRVEDFGSLDATEFDETRVIDLEDPAACWEGMSPAAMVPASAALMAALLRDK